MGMSEQPLLEIRNVKRHFGAVRAVDGVSLAVMPGEVRAVIGPNGAGKSTLFKMICGRVPPAGGAILFAGHNVVGMRPHAIFHLGICSTFQIAQIFPEMSVAENVVVGVLAHRKRTGDVLRPVRGMRAVWDEAFQVLSQIGLVNYAAQDSSSLALGDRKRLEIAIALAGQPRLLLMDEPTAGMSVPERQSTVALLEHIAREMNKTVLFTEHDMDVVFRFADRITVLHQGQIIAEGTPDQIRRDETVRTAYLGRRSH
jgi:ABC-type branched-subunit amino acid transport system ATPase component